MPTPFTDDEFGALSCVGVLTNVPDTEATLREFFRLVHRGGTIVSRNAKTSGSSESVAS